MEQQEPGDRWTITPIGWVESPLADPASAPKQGNEGTPDDE
jgi:hypothetical protein